MDLLNTSVLLIETSQLRCTRCSSCSWQPFMYYKVTALKSHRAVTGKSLYTYNGTLCGYWNSNYRFLWRRVIIVVIQCVSQKHVWNASDSMSDWVGQLLHFHSAETACWAFPFTPHQETSVPHTVDITDTLFHTSR